MSREEVIKLLKMIKSTVYLGNRKFFDALESAISYLRQPEQRWIPISERLPEEDGQYLITVKYKHVDGYEDIYAEHGEWYDGKWEMSFFGHCGEAEGIVAWMPLPEPYQEATP